MSEEQSGFSSWLSQFRRSTENASGSSSAASFGGGAASGSGSGSNVSQALGSNEINMSTMNFGTPSVAISIPGTTSSSGSHFAPSSFGASSFNSSREEIEMGITPLLKEYVRNLCQHPETFVNFPLEDTIGDYRSSGGGGGRPEPAPQTRHRSRSNSNSGTSVAKDPSPSSSYESSSSNNSHGFFESIFGRKRAPSDAASKRVSQTGISLSVTFTDKDLEAFSEPSHPPSLPVVEDPVSSFSSFASSLFSFKKTPVEAVESRSGSASPTVDATPAPPFVDPFSSSSSSSSSNNNNNTTVPSSFRQSWNNVLLAPATAPFEMTARQEAHALRMLQEVPELSDLRFRVCPREISEDRFWRIYFLLVRNKLNQRLYDRDVIFSLPDSLKVESHRSEYSILYSNYWKTAEFNNSGLDSRPSRNPWWRANEFGFRSVDRFNATLTEEYALKETTRAPNWTLSNVRHLREERLKVFKKKLREGVPSACRRLAWVYATGVFDLIGLKAGEVTDSFEETFTAMMDDYEFRIDHYQQALSRVFGSDVPRTFGILPPFCGNINFHQGHFLSHSGKQAARRILVLLAIEIPYLDFAPFIPDAVAMFLSFMTEDESYLAMKSLIDQSLKSCNFLPLSFLQMKMFSFTLLDLVEEMLPEVHKVITEKGFDLDVIVTEWFSRLFVGWLPYQVTLRVMDSFLFEGREMLFKTALAFLKRALPLIQSAEGQREFTQALRASIGPESDIDTFMESVFELRVKRSKVETLFRKQIPKLENVDPVHMRAFFVPNPVEDSKLATKEQFETIWSWLPVSFQMKEPKLVFSTENDGVSLSTLAHKGSSVSSSILLIKSKSGRVTGAFVSVPLRVGSDFFGTGQMFLFSLTPRETPYFWKPGQSELFIRLASDWLFVGGSSSGSGGIGLLLDRELWKCQSRYCTTFRNDPLCEDGNEFECVSVELIGLL